MLGSDRPRVSNLQRPLDQIEHVKFLSGAGKKLPDMRWRPFMSFGWAVVAPSLMTQ